MLSASNHNQSNEQIESSKSFFAMKTADNRTDFARANNEVLMHAQFGNKHLNETS